MESKRALETWELLRQYAIADEALELEAFVNAIGPSESFRALLHLDAGERELVLTTMPPSAAAGLLEEIPDIHAAGFIDELSLDEAVLIISEMPSVEQAHLLADMEEVSAEAILSEMTSDNAAKARELIRYPRDVAGGLMATDHLVFEESMSVAEVREALGEWVETRPHEEVHAFVLSSAGMLIGAIDFGALMISRRATPVSEILNEARFVRDNATLDELDNLFECHQLPFVAVMDTHQQLVGVVSSKDLLEALRARSDTDYLKSQGIVGGDEIRSMPVLTRARRRLSWLSVNVVLNMIAASVIAMYEETLSAVIALAVFLPIVSDMSGCSGNQAVAVSMRELSLGIVKPFETARVWLQEVSVGAINGLVLGLLVATAAWLWKGNPYLGVVVGIALAVNTVIAVSIGGTVPLLLKRFDVDPAVASGPILTTVTDMCGFFLVLSLATLMLPLLGN